MNSPGEELAKLMEAIRKDEFYRTHNSEFLEVFLEECLNPVRAKSLLELFDVDTAKKIMLESFSFFEVRDRGTKVGTGIVRYKRKTYRKIEILTNTNPFLVDSIISIFDRNKVHVNFFVQPIFSSERDEQGRLKSLSLPQEIRNKEFYALFIIDNIDDKQEEEIREKLYRSISDCNVIVEDFRNMEHYIKTLVRKLNNPIYLKKISEKEIEDIKSFLLWLLEENFVFLGIRAYSVEHEGDDIYIQVDKDSCYGVLRDISRSRFLNRVSVNDLPKITRDNIRNAEVVSIDKTNSISTVYDFRRMDFIAISELDDMLRVTKRHAILGLFTPKAFEELSMNIPFLRTKIERILFDKNLIEDSFEYNRLIDIFNTLPKDDIFITSIDKLEEILDELFECEVESRVGLYVRQTNLVHGFYLVAVLPVRFYSQKNIDRYTEYLKYYFKTEDIEYNIMPQSSRIIRIHYYISVGMDAKEDINLDELKQALSRTVFNWQEEFKERVSERFDPVTATNLSSKYIRAFSDEYTSNVSPEEAIADIGNIENLLRTKKQQVDIYKGTEGLNFVLYSFNKPSLYEVMPILDNLGLNVLYEDFFEIDVNGNKVYIERFSIESVGKGDEKKLNTVKSNFSAVWEGVVENDALNKLTTSAFLGYEYIDVLRAMCNFLMQVNFQLKRASIYSTVNKYATLSGMLTEYFDSLFSPARAGKGSEDIKAKIKDELDAIEDLQDYTIMNSMLNVIESTVRTNFYRKKKYHYISLKIDSSKVLTMPSPRPMYEIYVHSAFMEGCHLRGGKIARGGIRWSDRRDDFRLEILGLMKTQMVKNAVIVPVGSKGGFVVKGKFDSREKFLKHGKLAYKTLIRGILDLTDNYKGDECISPDGVIRRDDLDPYLVVAADKGTATFSDIANEIAEREYDFWLGDAFASGGKYGYDHKELGITARGAWVCVERHFRELGKDIYKETFSVVGIGDMSGDVFGNGMLLSKNILLKGAFNHIEIFLDPNPDPEISYKERKRLFDEVLTWKHYDRKLLSKGGFICDRNAKSVKLTPEVKEFLGTEADKLSGEEIIRLLLKADVDLLWNGGIGTYIKSSKETNEEVGDRINDSVRVDVDEVRAKIIGEGGNLGITQKARIEFALKGGKINTDALDNSAGVDMSDHEVNIKILLNDLLKREVIKDIKERNKILKSVTDEVAQKVLGHNYMQSFAVSLDEYRSISESDLFYDLTKFLIDKGIVHKEDYPFPTRKELFSRLTHGVGYTRPELCVILSLAKMFVYNELLLSKEVFSEDTIEQYAVMYFTPALKEKYSDYIKNHRLRNEMAFTFMTNLVMNNNGAISLMKINLLSGQSYPVIMKALIFAYDVLDVIPLRNRLFGYEKSISQKDIYKIALGIFDAIDTFAVNQLILVGPNVSLDTSMESEVKEWLREYIDLTVENGIFREKFLWRVEELSKLIDEELACEIAKLDFLDHFIPAYNITKLLNKDFRGVIESIENVKTLFGFDKIFRFIYDVPILNDWDRLAQFSILRNYIVSSAIVSTKVIKEFNSDADSFIRDKQELYNEYIRNLNTIVGSKPTNLHPIMLLYDKLQKLVQ